MTADDRLRLIRIKIERADKHLDELEAAILSLGEATFKTISMERESETAKPSLKVDPLYIYGFDIPAIAGDVVHNLRCALDHLAFQLVSVGVESGESRAEKWADIQFPILYSLDTYKRRKRRHIQGARREAIEAIDRLKPYKGGNDALWLLRNLDNTDKHSFILLAGEDTIVGGIPLKAYKPYFTSLDNPKDKNNVNLSSKEAFCEPAIGGVNPLLPTLHQLTELVSNIVASFRPFLECPITATEELSLLEEFRSLDWSKLPD